MNISACDYCGRGLYLSEGDTCKGCGAPFFPKAPRYDGPTLQAVYDASKVAVFGPGINIPIVPSNFNGRIGDLFRMIK